MIKGRYKMLVVLAIVGMFAIPMMQAKASLSQPGTGDIIVAESSKWFDLYGWDHAALSKGNSKIVEADPHFENWTWLELHLYPANARSLHEKSYSGNENYGRVENSSLAEIQNPNYYSYWKYGRVKNAKPWQRQAAVHFAVDKAWRKWHVGNYYHKPRPFDYKSFWIYNTKQVDGPYNSLGYGYYCSELVWASWYHVSKDYNLDDDNKRVTPNEIGNSPIVNWYPVINN